MVLVTSPVLLGRTKAAAEKVVAIQSCNAPVLLAPSLACALSGHRFEDNNLPDSPHSGADPGGVLTSKPCQADQPLYAEAGQQQPTLLVLPGAATPENHACLSKERGFRVAGARAEVANVSANSGPPNCMGATPRLGRRGHVGFQQSHSPGQRQPRQGSQWAVSPRQRQPQQVFQQPRTARTASWPQCLSAATLTQVAAKAFVAFDATERAMVVSRELTPQDTEFPVWPAKQEERHGKAFLPRGSSPEVGAPQGKQRWRSIESSTAPLPLSREWHGAVDAAPPKSWRRRPQHVLSSAVLRSTPRWGTVAHAMSARSPLRSTPPIRQPRPKGANTLLAAGIAQAESNSDAILSGSAPRRPASPWQKASEVSSHGQQADASVAIGGPAAARQRSLPGRPPSPCPSLGQPSPKLWLFEPTQPLSPPPSSGKSPQAIRRSQEGRQVSLAFSSEQSSPRWVQTPSSGSASTAQSPKLKVRQGSKSFPPWCWHKLASPVGSTDLHEQSFTVEEESHESMVDVFLRIRPQSLREQGEQPGVIVNQNSICVCDPQTARRDWFDFERIVDSTTGGCDQNRIFETIGERIVQSVLDGFSTCVFTLGQTGTGKTYTLIGTPEEPGLLPQAISQLMVAHRRCQLSCLELHMDKARDLLAADGANERSMPEIHCVPKRGVYVTHLTEVSTDDPEVALQRIHAAARSRAIARTRMNAASSRGHAVFQIVMEAGARLCIVDLAGRENERTTGCRGQNLAELRYINRSLFHLTNVIQALAAVGTRSVQGRVPFRDSKLTLLLSETLQTSRTFLVATISPAASSTEETMATLRLAKLVRQITTRSTRSIPSTERGASAPRS